MSARQSVESPAGPIRKGFIDVDGRTMHYVQRGSGPALLLLHAAPCSARVMEPLQAAWGAHFSTFAFDLPGFGLSDAPAGDPVVTAQLADAVIGAAERLGITRAMLYGRHTGAGVAIEAARRRPNFCHFVLTDGYPIFPTPYSEERLAEYLPPIEPRWDGAHLIWAWFRYREQHLFWPWDKRTLERRADTDVPDLDFLYRGTTELLAAGDSYVRVYASAFRHPGLAILDEVKVPVCYGNRPGDSQYRTVPLYPAHTDVRVFPRCHEAAAAEELNVLLARAPGEVQPPQESRIATASDKTFRGYIDLHDGEEIAACHVRGAALDRRGLPTLFLPDLPGGIDLHVEEIQHLSETAAGPIIGFDPWGAGHSVLPENRQVTVELWARQALAVLDHFGFAKANIVAHGTAGAIALALEKLASNRVGSLLLRSPAVHPDAAHLAEGYAPDIRPVWDGGNFLRLWHHLRDQELWFPWNSPSVSNARRNEPRLDQTALNRRAVLMLRQPAHYRDIWRVVLSYPVRDEIAAGAHGDLRLTAHPQDLFGPATIDAAAAMGLPLQLHAAP